MTEILAPAGSEKSAYAAIDAGADAIYLGLTSFSARSSAENFDFEALARVLKRAHFFGVKVYVAMNTLVKEEELESFISDLVAAHNAGADAIIIQDLYLGAYLKKTYPELVLHLSTQAGICNAEGAAYAKSLGFSRVILARETPLAEVQKIAKIIETEVFIQGALCTCFSGQCYLSSFAGGNSGNRGKCKQPCRKKYKIDREGFDDYAYAICLSDLKVGEDVGRLIEAGVVSFKIEGRMRRPEYVSAAVKYYKKLLENGVTESDEIALKRTYNRGNYTKGLIFGQDKSFISSAVQGHVGECLGTVVVENGKYICRTQKSCAEGDGLKILRGGRELCGAVCGGTVKGGVNVVCNVRLKNGDKVFITTDNKLNGELLDKKRALRVPISVTVAVSEPIKVILGDKTYLSDFTVCEAAGRPISADDIINCFNKVDLVPIALDYQSVTVSQNAFAPMSLLNAFRRQVYKDFYGDGKTTGKTIEKIEPLPDFTVNNNKNTKTAVIADSLVGVKADVGILKPADYNADLSPLLEGFEGERFLYLPPFLTSEEIDAILPRLNAFVGIYCGGNYSFSLAKRLNKKLFAGVGYNLSNSISVEGCGADYIALSKELTVREAAPLARDNTFYLTGGDLQVMDIIYCPFAKSCATCDKRSLYTLTDEEGRVFPLRRYKTSACRFELYNCDFLSATNSFTGALYERTLKNFKYKNHTKGHSQNGTL